ncbi:MAG: hypothetical protein AAFX56_13560 [Pseudomonadota bacterium]
MAEIQTGAEYAAGIALNMPRVQALVRERYHFIADYVFAGTTEKSGKTWREVRVGDEVQFQCELSVGNDLFAGVKVSVFDEENECHLELSLVDARVKQLVKRAAR